MFETKLTHNGLTGRKSSKNPSSRLALLVSYIHMSNQQGIKPTRMGYVRLFADHLKKRPHDLFTLALKLGVMVDTGEKVGREKVINLGPNAEWIEVPKSILDLIEKTRKQTR